MSSCEPGSIHNGNEGCSVGTQGGRVFWLLAVIALVLAPSNSIPVEAREDNRTALVADAIVQLQLGDPLLVPSKGVIASSNPSTIYSPATVGPVAFNAPGTSGPRWTGVINSSDLNTSPVGSSVTGVDGNDVLSFALVIENQGTSAEGAFDLVISDTVPTGFITPTTGLNLRVSYGDGTGPIDYTRPDESAATPDDLFAGGIELVDPSPTQGVCQAYSTSSGLNIIVVTYDLQVASDIPPNDPMTNVGALVNYAGDPGGPNLLSTPEVVTSTVTTGLPQLSKTIAGSTLSNTLGNDVAVGEIITYSATITVPEGVTSNAVLTDTLSAGLALVTSTVDSALSTGLSLSGSTVPTITPDGKTATFNLGDLTNANNNAPISATLTITYPVVVLNSADNTLAATQHNGVAMTFDGGSETAAASDVTVVEPTLVIDKTTSPTIGDAGDPITYTLDVTHTAASNADAFDVVVTDTLPADVSFSSWTPVSGVSPDSVVQANGVVTATWNTISTTEGSRIKLLATLGVTTQPSQTLTNHARLEWSSLPGDVTAAQSTYATDSTERTGDASNPGGALNDYDATSTAAITTESPTFSKTFVGTSEPSTTDPNVAVGELITYSVEITVPEGTTNNVAVTDTLDQGLAFVRCTGISASAALTTTLDFATACSSPTVGAYPNGDASAVNQGRVVTFTLGSITNSDSENSITETVAITYNAVVLNSTGNIDGATRANAAMLSYDGGTASASATAVQIAEPSLSFSKTVSANTGDAADPITYTLSITNPGVGSATAFDVVVTDTVPAGMTYSSSGFLSGSAPDSFTVVGGVITATWAAFTATETSQLQLTFTLDSNVNPSQTINNTGYLAWTSLPGELTTPQSSHNTLSTERTGNTADPGGTANDYATSNTAAITTSSPTLGKSIESTSLADIAPPDVTIGEVITYALGVTLTEGTTPSLVVTDTLPAGLPYVEGSASTDVSAFNGTLSAMSTTTATNQVIFTFASPITVTADNDPGNNAFRILFETRVADIGGNHDGTTLPNSAVLLAGAASASSNTITATVLEPSLSMSKVINPAAASPNDPITVTLSVTNSGTSKAYDVAVSDVLSDTQLTGIAEGTTPGGYTFSATPSSGNTIVAYSGGTLDAGASTTLTFGATLASSLSGVTVIANTANVTGTTMPGTDPYERSTGASASANLTVTSPDIGVLKIDGRTTVVPGQTTVYAITVSNSGTRDATGVVLTDTVPANTALVDASGLYTDTSGTLQWSAFDLTEGDSVTRLVTVTVDSPLPAAAHSITNTARAVDDGTHGDDAMPNDNLATDVDEVDAAPDLSIVKSAGVSSATTGETIAYTLTYSNTGNIGASGAIITETVPENMRYAGGSEWTCTPDNNAGSTCTQDIGILTADSISQTTSFTATVDVSVPAGTSQIANTAQIGDDGANGADPTPSDNSSTVSTPLTGLAPDFAIDKSDGGSLPAPGDAITYTIDFTNTGNIDASNVTVTETVPANTRYTGSGWTCTPGEGAGSVCTQQVASISGAGGAGSLQFTATITNPLPFGGSQITNTVQIQSDATPGDNANTITTTVNAAPALNITKSDGGTTTAPGGVVIYTLTYSNTGTIAASGVEITDTVPANSTLNSGSSSPGWSCATDGNAGSVCTYSVGTLAAGGGHATASFAVDVSSALLAGANPLTNTAYVSDDAGHTDSASDSTPISGAQPDLVVTKTHNGAGATAGSLVTFTLSYTNTGNIGAINVLISETVPANTTFAGPGSTWNCSIGDGPGTHCLRNVGTLASSGSGSVQFAAKVDDSLPITTTAVTNTVYLHDDGTNGTELIPSNNTYTDTVAISGLAPVFTLAKTASASTVQAGDTVTYSLSYTNTGNADATGVTVTETVPADTTYAGSGWSCQPDSSAGSTCTQSVGTLTGAGGAGSAQFVVTVNDPLGSGVSAISNEAEIGDDSSHTATASASTPVELPMAQFFFLPLISQMPFVPPTPTNTPTPTPITVLLEPAGMVSDAARDHLYLVSQGDRTVAVFKESTLTSSSADLLAKINVGTAPFGIGMVDGKVYVANSGGRGPASISVIDAATMTKVQDISLSSCGGQATHLAVNPNTHRVYTTLHASAKVAVVNSQSDSLVACVTTNAGAFGLAVDTTSNSVYVGNRDGLDLWRIDGATNTAAQVMNWSNGHGGGSPYYVGVNSSTRLLFAMVGLPSSDAPNKLYVYSIDSAGNLSGERIASAGNTDDGGFVVQSQCSTHIYIAETADNRVRILNSDLTLSGVVTATTGLIGQGPFGLLENPTLKRVYVSNKPANTLSVLNECPGPLAPVRAPASPTATPTASPAATKTPTPLGTATPGASLAPSATTAATHTPAPSQTPAPSKTPAPSQTPTVKPVPTETPAATPAPSETLAPVVAPSSTPPPAPTETDTPQPTAPPVDTETPEATPTQ